MIIHHQNYTCAPIIKNNLDTNPFIQRIMSDTANNGLYSLNGTPETNVNLAVCLDVLIMYNTLITNFGKADPTNNKFTEFVIKIIGNLIDNDVTLQCTDSLIFPNSCDSICPTIGASTVAVCAIEKNKKY